MIHSLVVYSPMHDNVGELDAANMIYIGLYGGIQKTVYKFFKFWPFRDLSPDKQERLLHLGLLLACLRHGKIQGRGNLEN